MPAVDKPTEADEDKTEKKSATKLEELGVVGTVLAAVGGGLGVLGLVAFFGAAILWLRMTKMGLPGNETLAVVPKSVLISTGASFLAPALLAAVAFTMALYMIDAVVNWGIRGRRLRKPEQELEETIEKLKGLELERSGLQEAKKTARDQTATATEDTQVPAQAETEVENQARAVAMSVVDIDPKIVRAKERIGEQEKKLVNKTGPLERRAQMYRKVTFTGFTILVSIVAARWAIGHYLSASSGVGELIQILIVVLLIAFIATVSLKTGAFGWVAVAAFLSVTVFIGMITYYRTVDGVKVEPAALLRKHGGPVFGFFVAQTGDRVYLGTQPVEGITRLDSIPREDVAALVVGNLQDPTTAEGRAIAFAHRLCLRARERKATGRLDGTDGGGRLGEEVAEGCTASDIRRLDGLVMGSKNS